MGSNPYFGVGGFGQGGFGNQPIEALPIGYYLSLLTSEYSNSVKLQKLLQVLLKKFDDVSQCLVQMDTAFDLDSAVGTQLDMLGQIVGVTRTLSFQPSLGSVGTSISAEQVAGSGTSFTLVYTPLSGTLQLFNNGIAIWSGVDYTLVGASITMSYAVTAGLLRANYQLSSIGGTPVFNEQVAGSGTAFTLAHSPIAGTLQLYNNGVAIWPGLDYSTSGTAIVMNYSVTAGDLRATYQFGSSTSEFVAAEQVPGSGTAFTLTSLPIGGTLQLYNGGLAIWPGVDYSIVSTAVTMNYSVSAGAIYANYQLGSVVSPTLDDLTYRLLIKAKIGQNQWDGTQGGLYAVWIKLFPTVSIVVADNQNMTATLFIGGLPSSILIDMIAGYAVNGATSGVIQNGLIIPRPEGVEYTFELGELPAFGFDLNNSYVAGFDIGKWSG